MSSTKVRPSATIRGIVSVLMDYYGNYALAQ